MGNEVLVTSEQTPIEIALGIDEEGMTTARKLYSFLELAQGQFSRWCRRNIIENDFAMENEDYVRLDINVETPTGGVIQREDYKLSASFAKKLSMQSKSAKGEQARNYFIGCEQSLKIAFKKQRAAELERAKGIAVRQALTKAIQQSSENERMHGHAYSTYTDVIYKSIFGKNAKQLREDFGISRKENMRDCFSEEDLVKIQNAEMLVSALVGYGWGYNEIKEFILNKGINKIAA